jgi:ornithine decarboxylase
MDRFASTLDAVRRLRPEEPMAICRPHRVRAAARWFLENFAGDVLYAVKANPSPWVLDALWAAGVTKFDVASEVECALVRGRFPTATLAFMHPVKSRRAIRRAYFDHGCRIFALDTQDELRKILEETDGVRDLTLVVRLAVSNADATLPLAAKFGVSGAEAVDLIRTARAATEEDLGLSFHVGSQCMKPSAYRQALAQARALIVEAGVTVDVIDVGGGFPSIYPGMTPPPMLDFTAEIERAFEAMPVTMNCQLWAEPGRALVAEAGSIVVRVDLRKGDALYVNDGAYGNLFDATHVKWPFPVRHMRPDAGESRAPLSSFRLYGPTCDSIDVCEGPFHLPADVREGDFIEIGMLGAYGVAMATRFNGFGRTVDVVADDAPWESPFGAEAADAPRTGAAARRG